MLQRIHSVPGLPRSGPTLLAALLRQNPRLHTGISGPLTSLFGALLDEMSARNEFSAFIDDAQRRHLLRGLFDNFHADTPAEVVFDTSRTWCTRMPALADLFPTAKVIACVREVPWIVDSFERLIRHNAFQPSSIFSYSPGGTVYARANGIVGPEGLLGYAYDALKEAFYGEHTDRLLLVQFETLTSDPLRALAAVYAFLDEPPFAHDIEHVNFDASAFDAKIGTPRLHAVRPQVKVKVKVKVQRHPTLLPPDLFRRFENDAFWRDPRLNPHGVRIV